MGKVFQQIDQMSIRRNEWSVRKNEQVIRKYEQAKFILNSSNIPIKTLAHAFGVSPRYIQQMCQRETRIPDKWVDKILREGTKLLLEQRQAIDSYIDELLELAYGPNWK